MAKFRARVNVLYVYECVEIEADTLEDAIDAFDEMLISQIEENGYLEKALVVDRSIYEVGEEDD